MTREEFNRLYLDKAVHCDTEEKANHFLALADSVGYKWMSGYSLIEKNNWGLYKEKTCYRIIEDEFVLGSTIYYGQHGHPVIEYQPQPKFKEGDKVRVKDTIYTTINGKVGVIVSLYSVCVGFLTVKVDDKLWFLSENDLEKVEEPTNKEETIDDIIEEIEYHQKAINVLCNRLKRKAKGERK